MEEGQYHHYWLHALRADGPYPMVSIAPDIPTITMRATEHYLATEPIYCTKGKEGRTTISPLVATSPLKGG